MKVTSLTWEIQGLNNLVLLPCLSATLCRSCFVFFLLLFIWQISVQDSCKTGQENNILYGWLVASSPHLCQQLSVTSLEYFAWIIEHCSWLQTNFPVSQFISFHISGDIVKFSSFCQMVICVDFLTPWVLFHTYLSLFHLLGNLSFIM